MNVAYHLNRLDLSTAMISRVGKDEWGRKLLKFMQEKKIPIKFVQVDSEHSTGKVLVRVSKNEVAYNILKPAAWDFIEWKEEFSQLLDNARYFVFGSLVARNEISRNTLFQLLERTPKKVLDINLRVPDFHKKEVEKMLEVADVLKLNATELKLIVAWYGRYRSEKDQMKVLQDRFEIRTIITTLGAKGALALHEGSWYAQSAFRVRVKNTVGSGDAFLAGYLFKIIEQANVQEALEFACGLGALITTHDGACQDYSFTELKSLIRKKPDLISKVGFL